MTGKVNEITVDDVFNSFSNALVANDDDKHHSNETTIIFPKCCERFGCHPAFCVENQGPRKQEEKNLGLRL